jgi:hypothetical protein
MATKTIEAELLDLEKRYWQAMKDQCAGAPRRLKAGPAGLGPRTLTLTPLPSGHAPRAVCEDILTLRSHPFRFFPRTVLVRPRKGRALVRPAALQSPLPVGSEAQAIG